MKSGRWTNFLGVILRGRGCQRRLPWEGHPVLESMTVSATVLVINVLPDFFASSRKCPLVVVNISLQLWRVFSQTCGSVHPREATTGSYF